MPTRQENSLKSSDIKKLGIIAGAGVIPAQLVAYCHLKKITPVVVGIKGSTDKLTPDLWARIGKAAKIIKFFKANEVKDVVMIGAVKRPTLIDLWPDFITLIFFLKAWMKSFGDSDLLSAARGEIEKRGFCLHGIHKFLPHLLMPVGDITMRVPTPEQRLDIQLGIQESQKLGAEDIGQAVIVKDGNIIATEDKRGTSAMIKRYGVAGGILVKSCKPQQDKDLDLPTIGPNTVALCAFKNMAGIVAHAGHSLLVEREKVEEIANKNNIFVLGVKIEE